MAAYVHCLLSAVRWVGRDGLLVQGLKVALTVPPCVPHATAYSSWSTWASPTEWAVVEGILSLLVEEEQGTEALVIQGRGSLPTPMLWSSPPSTCRPSGGKRLGQAHLLC